MPKRPALKERDSAQLLSELREARVKLTRPGGSVNVLLDRLVPAREAALAAGVPLEDVTRVEYEADVSVLGDQKARASWEKDFLQRRFQQLAEEASQRHLLSRGDIRPLMRKAERSGGRRSYWGGRGIVELDLAEFREVVHGLEAALGHPVRRQQSGEPWQWLLKLSRD